MKMRLKILLALSLFYVGVPTALAACSLVSSGVTPAAVTLPLSGVISVSADMPTGTLLYEGAYEKFGSVEIGCTSAGQFYYQARSTSALADSGVRYNRWIVYNTSYPGVGVAFSQGPVNIMTPSASCVSTYGCKAIFTISPHRIFLIKTGEISPGRINGSILPVSTAHFGQSGAMVEYFRIGYSGGITITTPTCTTPDLSVDLGSWHINQLKGKNSATDWKNASINMKSCGRFYGLVATHSQAQGGSIAYQPATVPNTWTLKLTPQSGVINTAGGIMAITPGEKSARGIGIQLGYGSTSTAGSNLADFTTAKTGNMPQDGTATVTIPIAARYIQTEDTVTPGKADGKVTFTISYK